MYNENTVNVQTTSLKKKVESEVMKALQQEDYTLNTVNCCGENLLHISAANGCLDIIKEIFHKQNSSQTIDRKNKFGWTPLMLAIRNKDVNTVKYLLENNSNVNESTYLGMSVLGLAAAINIEMFEIVYKACPSALLNSVNDDITPLCIAALKNDRNLFFRLLELGFEVSKINEYTQIMMKQSNVPEIANLAEKHLDIEDYWNDISDNISFECDLNINQQLHSFKQTSNSEDECVIQAVQDKENENNNKYKNNNNLPNLSLPVKPILMIDSPELNNKECNNNIPGNFGSYSKCHKLNLMIPHLESTQNNLISPILSCAFDEMLPTSPNLYFTKNNHDNIDEVNSIKNNKLIQNENGKGTSCLKSAKCLNEIPLQRLQAIRPPDLNIQTDTEDPNATLEYIPEFSPIRSPYVPSDINDENVFGEGTPTPPHYKTPPRGMILNSEEAKMFTLLKRYGLSQHVPIFLEQEVDVELFMTLTDADLIEIGITNILERKAILNVVMNHRKLLI